MRLKNIKQVQPFSMQNPDIPTFIPTHNMRVLIPSQNNHGSDSTDLIIIGLGQFVDVFHVLEGVTEVAVEGGKLVELGLGASDFEFEAFDCFVVGAGGEGDFVWAFGVEDSEVVDCLAVGCN